MTKKQVIKYLQNKLKEIDNGDFWEFQSEYGAIKETINFLSK